MSSAASQSEVNSGVTMTYLADDCGGTLPDADSVGAIASASVCNGILTFGVIQPGSANGPGVVAHAVNPCGNFCADAVFFGNR